MRNSHHRNCRGQSIGRVLHFIHHACYDYHLREHCSVGGGNVMYEGKEVASITWSLLFGHADVPYLKISPEFVDQFRIDDWQKEAIQDCLQDRPELGQEEGRQELDQTGLNLFHILNPELHMRAALASEIIHNTKVTFFLAQTYYNSHYQQTMLFMQCDQTRYLWDPKIGFLLDNWIEK